MDKLNKLALSKSDGHYNRSGHEVAAKAIVDTLVEEKIIDGKYVVYADSGPETSGRNRNGNALSLP